MQKISLSPTASEYVAICNAMKTLYFDSAATTYQKPHKVFSEADRAFRLFSANSGRGSHFLSLKASEKIFRCRTAISRAFGASPENIIFTFNTTYALNMAIKGVAAKGDHFLISNLEHNSVLRPIHKLSCDKIIDYTVFDAYFCGKTQADKVIDELQSKLRPNTKCIICTHASNICSYSPPIYEIGKFCAQNGLIFIVDAAQSAGHTKIDIAKNNIDILCAPAHKGLYGPQGLGVMILGEKIIPDTLIEGGSGINSLIYSMPDEPPERYEAGTLPCHSICGLLAGLEFVENYGYNNISQKEAFLWDRLYRGIEACDRIKIYDKNHRGGILLFNVLGKSSSLVASQLSSCGICVRSGYHCAALAHKTLNTDADGCGGAVRVSFSIFNTSEEIDILAKEILRIAKE